MAYENILFEKKDGIAFITFNRPKVLNALNRKTVEELRDALLDAMDDSSVRVVILTGAGEKSFVAGADVGIEKRLSIAFDVLGRHSTDAPRLSGSTFKAAGSSATFQDIAFGVGSLNVVNGSFGLKANVAGTTLVTFNLQFKLNDAGVRAKVTPLVGIEYGF